MKTTSKKSVTLSRYSSTEEIANAYDLSHGKVLCFSVESSDEDDMVSFIQYIPEVTDIISNKTTGGYYRRALEFVKRGSYEVGKVYDIHPVTKKPYRIARLETTVFSSGYNPVTDKDGNPKTFNGEQVFKKETLVAQGERDVILKGDGGSSFVKA